MILVLEALDAEVHDAVVKSSPPKVHVACNDFHLKDASFNG